MALYAFDGTLNIRDRKEPLAPPKSRKYGPERSAARDTGETNVHRFAEYYGLEETYYLEGVGTRFWWLGRLLGGGFGAGGKRRIREMYRELMKRFHECGDQAIDVVGFSRGAALAVHFANAVNKHGVRNPAGARHLFLWYYREFGITFRFPKELAPGPATAAEIHFLGLWDEVATFGFPFRPFRNKAPTWDIDIVPPNVSRCMHAMSLDETRSAYDLIRPRSDVRGRVYEVWFRGVHSNIGGGYLDRGLSDIALAWMMNQAVWTWGLNNRESPARFIEALSMLEPDAPADQPLGWRSTTLETLEPDPNGELGRPFDLARGPARPLGDEPKIHHSVLMRGENRMTDFYSSANRQLLRPLPGHVNWIYDPPIDYGGRKEDLLSELALAAFIRIPVVPSEWLRVGDHYLFRSDDWVGLGTRYSRYSRADRLGHIDKLDFFEITKAWILAGKPVDDHLVAIDTSSLTEELRQTLESAQPWVVAGLAALDRYLPWSSEIARLSAGEHELN